MRVAALALLSVAVPGAARSQASLDPGTLAQEIVDEERRLIDVHSLLVDLPPLQAPASLESGTVDASLEAVIIPYIDGTIGTKREITASDRTRVFPRPRVAFGLPAPEGFRAFVGLSYIPPVAIRGVSTHYGALEAGLGWAPGALRVGVRGHAVYADSWAPVTDPATRDRLQTGEIGADLAIGARLGRGRLELDPYVGGGVVSLRGRFRVTLDGTVLRSTYTGPSYQAGLRLLIRSRWEVVTEVDGYPGRLVHPALRIGYLFGG
jgi:hypothetical protein